MNRNEEKKAVPGTRRTVSLGMIGAGRRLRSVVQSLLAEAGGSIEVRAVHDPDTAAVEAVRAAFGRGIEACPSEEALVSHPGLDWVFIGSLNCHHARQAILALHAGRNVFCEKPLATCFEDCLKVREAVETTRRTFAFGLVLRYSPYFRKIHDLLKGGEIGELISFEFNETLSFNHGGYIFGNWRRKREWTGSHLLEKCCHDLDIANWLTGSLPIRAASFGGKDFFVPKNAHHVARVGPNAEGHPAYWNRAQPHLFEPFSPGSDIVDNQVAILQYKSGVRATFHTNCNAGIPERRLYLCGTEGAIRADAYTGLIEVRRIGHDNPVMPMAFGSSNGHAGGDEVMARGLVETMLHGAPPLATVDDGIEACVAAFAIDQAMESGQVADLDRFWRAIPGHGAKSR